MENKLIRLRFNGMDAIAYLAAVTQIVVVSGPTAILKD